MLDNYNSLEMMLDRGIREHKDYYRDAQCPFCNDPIPMPSTIVTEFGEIIGGDCRCGAVYTCDLTGHNIGEALLDALIFACGNDWDRVFNIGYEDYNESVFNYDINTHRIWNIRDIRRDQGGKIIFIRIKKKN